MSLRKSRKRGAAGKAAKAVMLVKMAQPVAGAVKSFRRARSGKGLRRRSSGRRPAVMLLGLLGLGGAAAAAAKKRGGDADLGYGPPNESHPSHETLAPSKAAAGQATNGESSEEARSAQDAAKSGTDPEGDADYSIAAAAAQAEPAGPPGDDAGTDEPGREES